LKEKLLKYLDILIGAFSLLVLIALLTEYGFEMRGSSERFIYAISYLLIFLFVINKTLILFFSNSKINEIKKLKFPYLFTLLLLFQYLLIACGVYKRFIPYDSNTIYYHAVTQLFIFFIFSYSLSKANITYVLNRKFKPVQLLILSFIILIIIGALLLKMPSATVTGNITFIDALFTSTSAVCVTGLIILDTAVYFTTFGKIIIMLLIQLGGLGIMTSTAFLTMLFFNKITVSERFMLREIYTHESLPDIPNIVKTIFFSTISLELISSILLFFAWFKDFPTIKMAIFHSIFHSISAFCNAGFSTFSESLLLYKDNIPVNLIISFLIILGGIGFLTIFNIVLNIKTRNKKIISTHTKIVLTATGLLLFSGTIIIFLLEYRNSFSDFTLKEKILSAFFQSVSSRTAGFNTIEIGLLTIPTYLFISLLMFIGGSPGSTAGGIKTTTIGILIATVFCTLKNKESVELFKRKIDNQTVFKALSLLVLSLSYIFITFILLFLVENKPPITIFFEVLSAFGTVGLSTGITPYLSTIGKILILITMFLGRLGPITIALAVSKQHKNNSLQYPVDSNIMIG
jgi:trk system potassium uptake protein